MILSTRLSGLSHKIFNHVLIPFAEMLRLLYLRFVMLLPWHAVKPCILSAFETKSPGMGSGLIIALAKGASNVVVTIRAYVDHNSKAVRPFNYAHHVAFEDQCESIYHNKQHRNLMNVYFFDKELI